MHCKSFFALIVSCMILSVAAAPIPNAEPSRSIAGDVVEVPRLPEPEPEPGCRMYACIWCVFWSIISNKNLATIISALDLPRLSSRAAPLLSTLLYPSLSH
ncbi:hypothetical protein R3P38DRAFT_1835616 [Favolaschia claudopus]|uniref:Uncharacterized protein n=1 Tax=Favolaschia claudopus TaxID=2862362 RepID=A0AAW0A4P5_9AGAR